MRNEVLDALNKLIREEKGNRVAEESSWLDAEVDSFGQAVVFMGLDAKYDYFAKGQFGADPFAAIPYATLTVKEIIDTCLLETTSTLNPQ